MKARHGISVGAVAGSIFVLTLFFAGCARPPTEEMDSAVEAVTRAEADNDAVLYAQGTLARAREALSRMRAAADARNFDAARAYAAEAIDAAERAVAEGRAGAERARSEAHAVITDLSPRFAETERGINDARNRGLDLDFRALEDYLNGARATANEAVEDYNAGRYALALENGRNARNDLRDIDRRVAGAAVLTVRQGK